MIKIYLFLFCVFAQNVAGSKSTEMCKDIHYLPDPGSLIGDGGSVLGNILKTNIEDVGSKLILDIHTHSTSVILFHADEWRVKIM